MNTFVFFFFLSFFLEGGMGARGGESLSVDGEAIINILKGMKILIL